MKAGRSCDVLGNMHQMRVVYYGEVRTVLEKYHLVSTEVTNALETVNVGFVRTD